MGTTGDAEDVDVVEVDDDLFAPTRMLLFAPLGSTDMPSAVVHRLRAAIGLGLLPDGKQLPKEADLATQLGVTTFALREALAELRKQGLLVTRAGKYGGSFVTYPADSERLEQDELVELSSAELRDVGDWRQMLAAHAAALAAQRASESNIKMLSAYAARVGEAAEQSRRPQGARSISARACRGGAVDADDASRVRRARADRLVVRPGPADRRRTLRQFGGAHRDRRSSADPGPAAGQDGGRGLRGADCWGDSRG